MKVINVGKVQITFSSAVVTVTRRIEHRDWVDEGGSYAPQEIEIIQAKDSATVVGLSGTQREMGPHQVRVVSAAVFTPLDLARHFQDLHGVETEALLDAMFTTDYPWGKLVALNWSAMGYVPGGVTHVILPNGHPAVDLGALKLEWPSVEINPLPGAYA
ncbi:hypothetical protein AACH06_29910 [Ideonella sp. DXS29W]|uniref:Phage tail protein n=1 Tax=Ideonella lacteola TaxID=2984193 RepID=A0ABU9C2Y9_9BURK